VPRGGRNTLGITFGRGIHNKIWEGKNVQNSATTFGFDRKYLRNGSTRRKSESTLSATIPPTLVAEKLVWTLVHQQKCYRCPCWPTQVDLSGDYISVLRECMDLKFLHALEIDQGLLAHTQTGTGSPKNFKGGHWNLASNSFISPQHLRAEI